MPLKESIIVVSTDENSQEYKAEESKQSKNLCDDLEKLLETGYAELLRTGYDKSSDEEEKSVGILDDSPFPKGIAVFDEDNSNDDDDLGMDSSSPFSNE